MPMLNYLGSSSGGAQTMPGAVPGVGQVSPAPGGAPLIPVSQGPSGAMPFMGGAQQDPMAGGGAQPQYSAITQADGTILLHILNPDGSLGPAVKIINAVKPQQQAAGGPPR